MNLFKKWTAVFLAVCAIVLTSSGFDMIANAATNAEYEAQLKDLNAQLEQISKEQAEIQNKINSTKNEKEKKLAEKKYLETQISNTQKKVDLTTQKIALLEKDISTKTADIEAKQNDIDTNYEIFKKRLRAAYMSGDANSLALVLDADNLGDFLTKTEVVTRIAEFDRKLINSLVNDKKQLEDDKAILDANKKDLEGTKKELDSLKSQLNTQVTAVKQQIQDISALEQEFLNDKAALQKKAKEMEAEIESIYSKLRSEGKFVGGTWGWPVPGYTNITSRYGWRFNNTDFHTGVDISGANIYGANIVASNAGRVAFVNETYKQGVGYGKYVILDHGGGYSTLYAHTSEILVKEGQVVKKGEIIAKVGSTGWSTGPHLHFEIRIDGKHQNPQSYLGYK